MSVGCALSTYCAALGLQEAEMWTLSKAVYMRYLLGCVPLLKLARQESVSSIKHFSFVSISFGGGGCSFFFFPGSHSVSLV